MQELSFNITDKDGKQVKYQTIATYEDEKTKKKFIVYTDNTYNSKDQLKIYCSLFKIINKKIKVIEITMSNDKKIALNLIKKIIQS